MLEQLGIFSSIVAPDWALYVLHQVLGTVSANPQTHDTLLQSTPSGWSVQQRGIWSVGIMSQIAGEMLHRKRILTDEHAKLEVAKAVTLEQQQVVEQAQSDLHSVQESGRPNPITIANGWLLYGR